MRKNYFLFPEMNILSGGHIAQVKLLENVKSICEAESVTYISRTSETLFLDDLLQEKEEGIFFIHWGPHVPELINRLKGQHVVYVAYSTGYDFVVPAGVPVIAVSHHTQAYWGRYSNGVPIFYLPPEVSPEFTNWHKQRDIDVLVQQRKSSHYLMNELIPALRPRCNVVVLDEWIDSLTEAEFFNRSKLYVYDSAAYWSQHDLSEGFGLPPLEAMACGCTVFSSLNDALSDYLDPGINGYQIRAYSLEYDVERILRAIQEWRDPLQEPFFLQEYRRESIRSKLPTILKQLNDFFDRKPFLAPPGFASVPIPPHLEKKRLQARLKEIEVSRLWRITQRIRNLYFWARRS